MGNTEEPEQNADNKLEKGATFYASASWLRTTIVGLAGAMGLAYPVVPALVSAVDVALTIKAQKIAERRLNELCQSWEQEIQQIPPHSIDKDYIESEEFFDLVFKAWESTKRTRHNEKIHLYAKLLAGAVPFQDRAENSPEDYLSVLTELSVQELELAHALYDQQKEYANLEENELQWLKRIGAYNIDQLGKGQSLRGHGQWQHLLSHCPSLEHQNIQFALLRLQKCGVANELTGTFLDYTGGVFVITPTFREMMRYLQKSDD